MKEKIEKVLHLTKGYLSLEEIFYLTGTTTQEEKEEIKKYLQKQVKNYEIDYQNDKYILMRKTSKRKGVFKSGKTIDKVIVGNEEFILEKDEIHNAIDKDEVLVNIPYLEYNRTKKSKRKKKTKKLNHVTIEKIINRNLDSMIGQVYQYKDKFYLRPDDKEKRKLKVELTGDDFVPGEKVFVKLKQDKQSLDNNMYHTSMEEKIRFANEPETDIQMEAYKLGIYKGFSNETLEELQEIPNEVREEDKKGKADLTNWEIFTIDGDDTKDIDDAISLYEDKDGNTVLGVHIAYPAYYIKKDGAIYQEALLKGTSCYPTSSRVFPMLHPKLSNGICSLNPNVERLALSYIITFDKNANVIDYKIMESVIKSNIQMTYTKVNDLLDKNIIHNGYEEHKETLLKMKELSDKLQEKRRARGELNILSKELKISLDEKGKAISIDTREMTTSDKIIESFMVASAECYSDFCTKYNIPCVYRNHQVPEFYKINKFLQLLESCGMPYKEKIDCNSYKSIQQLSDFVNATGQLSPVLINRFVRSLQKADFGLENIGHSGLASSGHVPNTSPIRRGNDFINQYSLQDLYLYRINSQVVQRQIEEKIPELQKKSIANLKIYANMNWYSNETLALKRTQWSEEIDSLTEHLSLQEINADRCERLVNKMKIAEKMSEEKGKIYEGIISGFNQNNIYIQLDNLIEGFINVHQLPGNHIYNEQDNYIKSPNNEDNYYFGDRIKVSVKSANKKLKQVEFKLEEKIKENTLCKKVINSKTKKK